MGHVTGGKAAGKVARGERRLHPEESSTGAGGAQTCCTAGPLVWPCSVGDDHRALLPAAAAICCRMVSPTGGDTESLIITATLLAEKASEWEEPFGFS